MLYVIICGLINSSNSKGYVETWAQLEKTNYRQEQINLLCIILEWSLAFTCVTDACVSNLRVC